MMLVPRKIRLISILGFISLTLTGCANWSYYLHSINGHYAIIDKSRKINTVLNDKNTPPDLSNKLQKVAEIREFAINQLHLPESESYTRYADLERTYALKNLFAAREFSVQGHRWCYPFVGCAGYRGYFDQKKLAAFQKQMESQGFDVYVGNVAAYSTLGWFDDPVLNTFIHWPEERLAGLIFHELAHQHVYIKGDSRFNESFAMATQQLGVERWLQAKGEKQKLSRYRKQLQNRQQVITLIINARSQLQQLYAQNIDDEQKRLKKKTMMEKLKEDYANLAGSFTVPDGFKHWFAKDLNNAQLASVSTYYEQIPLFRKIFQYQQKDFKSFLDYVKNMQGLNDAERLNCLQQWQSLATSQDLLAMNDEKKSTNITACST